MDVVEIKQLKRTGDHDEFEVAVAAPDGKTHSCYLSISGSQLTTWNEKGGPVGTRVVEDLVQAIVDARGDQPPATRYTFDTYNCAQTLQATVEQIRNMGDESFVAQ